jgi:transcription antitermination factor NusG
MQQVISYKNHTIKRSAFIPHWYAVYTRHSHEKKVFKQLQQMEIEAYLPLNTTIRQWKDRKKKISLPLFSCYVFVNINEKKYYNVLNIPGVVRFVTFEGKAVAIPEKQIRMVRNLLEQDIDVVEVKENLYNGAKVEIIAGSLAGISGELIYFAGKTRVIIRLDEISKSIMASVPMHLLRLIE